MLSEYSCDFKSDPVFCPRYSKDLNLLNFLPIQLMGTYMYTIMSISGKYQVLFMKLRNWGRTGFTVFLFKSRVYIYSDIIPMLQQCTWKSQLKHIIFFSKWAFVCLVCCYLYRFQWHYNISKNDIFYILNNFVVFYYKKMKIPKARYR